MTIYLTGWYYYSTITDQEIDTVSSLLKIKYVEIQKNEENPLL